MDDSNDLRARQEQAITIQVEKYYRKAKEILSLNWEFLEKLAKELAEKKVLHSADIQRIKSECKITPVNL
jgi:ATP-dependent Zn protease